MDENGEPHGASGERAGAAIGIAISEAARDPALAEDARTLLRQQARLAQLQADDLSKDGALMRRSLHMRHASEIMKFAFELLIALVLLAIVAALGTAMWSAAHDNGLVIEAFSVPPDFAQRGLSGEVVASQLLDKLARMQQETNSIRPADTYRNNWGDDIKVEIPDTGISIGELNRYLRRWLGHETHISGEIYRTAAGIAVTARAQDAGETFAGKNGDLDALLQKAAEAVYAQTQPYRYAAFLAQASRNREAMRAAQSLAADANPAERAWALALLGNLYLVYRTPDEALATLRAGVAADPGNAHAWDNLSSAELELGLLDDGYRHTERALSLYDKGAVAFDPGHVAIVTLIDRAFLASALGDYRLAIDMDEAIRRLPDQGGSQNKAAIDEADEWARSHDLTRAARLLSRIRPVGDDEEVNDWFQRVDLAWLEHDWLTLSKMMEKPEVLRMLPTEIHPLLQRLLDRLPQSFYAEAKAEEGDLAEARRLIAATPGNCYDCVRMRGKIDAAAKDWAAAAYWFAKAVQEAPVIPAAWTDWGAMLLAKGDRDGAIAKFAIAYAKGPHFADPLELWGEALMQKDRSDLALAKFEQANTYAPNWGRLHLKWGEALEYVGQRKDAQAQFAAAGRLDLFPREKRELQQHTMQAPGS